MADSLDALGDLLDKLTVNIEKAAAPNVEEVLISCESCCMKLMCSIRQTKSFWQQVSRLKGMKNALPEANYLRRAVPRLTPLPLAELEEEGRPLKQCLGEARSRQQRHHTLQTQRKNCVVRVFEIHARCPLRSDQSSVPREPTDPKESQRCRKVNTTPVPSNIVSVKTTDDLMWRVVRSPSRDLGLLVVPMKRAAKLNNTPTTNPTPMREEGHLKVLAGLQQAVTIVQGLAEGLESGGKMARIRQKSRNAAKAMPYGGRPGGRNLSSELDSCEVVAVGADMKERRKREIQALKAPSPRRTPALTPDGPAAAAGDAAAAAAYARAASSAHFPVNVAEKWMGSIP